MRGAGLVMITYYKTSNGRITNIENYEPNCWVKCVSPTEKDINYLPSITYDLKFILPLISLVYLIIALSVGEPTSSLALVL